MSDIFIILRKIEAYTFMYSFIRSYREDPNLLGICSNQLTLYLSEQSISNSDKTIITNFKTDFDSLNTGSKSEIRDLCNTYIDYSIIREIILTVKDYHINLINLD